MIATLLLSTFLVTGVHTHISPVGYSVTGFGNHNSSCILCEPSLKSNSLSKKERAETGQRNVQPTCESKFSHSARFGGSSSALGLGASTWTSKGPCIEINTGTGEGQTWPNGDPVQGTGWHEQERNATGSPAGSKQWCFVDLPIGTYGPPTPIRMM